MNKLGKIILRSAIVTSAALTAILPGLTVFADGTDAPVAATGDPQATEAPQQNAGWGIPMWAMLLIYVGIFVLIGYFLIFRPNKKRKKEEEAMRASLTLGSEVTTIGGVCGRVVNIKDDNITIETSLDRTLMEIKNWAIRDIKKVETSDDNVDKKD